MFFKKDDKDDLIDICALLIHAAKIDENYSLKEEKIIKQTLQLIGAEKEKLEEIIKSAKIIENDSNQILSFTKKVKNMNNENKIQIIEALWKIIYSNNDADIYETNLMRRLGGLLYIDNKIMGDIKEKVRKENL
tara:strand:+ start:78 stop:479 length:402 start_codon:yes stop_codon:yes gene_type:complete